MKIVVVALLLLATAHAAVPVLPNQYEMKWDIIERDAFQPLPPFTDASAIPAPYRVGRGHTYYDWDLRNLREDYYDFCVPIFPVHGNDYSCTFLNVNETTFLLNHNATNQTGGHGFPACCVFEKPWFPPPPDFLKLLPVQQTLPMHFHGNQSVVDWFMNGKDYQSLFAYGVYQGQVEGHPVPAAFLFNGIAQSGASGWCQQNFYDFTTDKPPASVWQLPDACKTATKCDWPPSTTTTTKQQHLRAGLFALA